MIAAIGARGASYSITIPQNAKVKAPTRPSATTLGRRSRTPRGGEAADHIEPGRRRPLRGAAKPAKRACITPQRLLGDPGQLWTAPPQLRPTETTVDRQSSRRQPPRPSPTVECAIRDLKEGSGLSRCPSGQTPPTALLACCVLAHNLGWAARLERTHPARQLTVAATIRNRLLTVPGRLRQTAADTDCACRSTGHGHTTFTTALQQIRNLPQLI